MASPSDALERPPADAPGPEPAPAVDAASPWAITYAKRTAGPFEHVPRGRVRVTLLTDPWSVWCWGFEPVRRVLVSRFPAVEFRNLVGGLFPTIPDPREAGFDLDSFFAVVQRTTGMPIRIDGIHRDRPRSTYPACIATHAVRLLRPDASETYLRALREAAYLDGRNISDDDVAADVAAAVGVERSEFLDALRSGEPERDFRERLAMLESLDLNTYPTVLVTSGDRTVRMEGFHPLPTVMSVIRDLTGRLFAPAPPPTVEEAVRPGERVATREIAELLGVSTEEAYDALARAETAGRIVRTRHPGGDVWARSG